MNKKGKENLCCLTNFVVVHYLRTFELIKTILSASDEYFKSDPNPLQPISSYPRHEGNEEKFLLSEFWGLGVFKKNTTLLKCVA